MRLRHPDVSASPLRITERKALVAAVLLVALAVIAPHPGLLYIDTRPDLYLNPGRVLSETFSTWVAGTGLGTNNYGMGYLPVAAIVWTTQSVGIPPWLSMRLWRFLLYVVAGLGARALFRSLARSEGRTPGAFPSLLVFCVYVVNPYVVAGANTTPIMLPYALLPWLVLALRRSFRTRQWWVGSLGFGLVFFLMSGINAGVVSLYLLAAVPVVALDARIRERISWWPVLRGLGAAGLASIAVSAYWLLGTVTALGAASSVAEGTEDPHVVAAVTSFAEVSRGLGSWLLYGADQLGPYLLAFSSYVTNPVVVVASFTTVVLALAGLASSRSTLRPLALTLVLLGLVLMAGSNPPEHPSPFGRAMSFGFDHVPFLLAFRTTFKAGPIAFLGMTILVGLGAQAWWPRLSTTARGWSVSTIALLMVLSVTPALVGRLYPAGLPIPDYWTTAIDDLDTRAVQGRVWVVPGETNATYRWRTLGVDDFFPALLERDAVYHRSFPAGTAAASNASTAVDQAIETGLAPPDLVSTYARYLGVGDVLVRNDMVWEVTGAARPSAIVDTVEADSGLRPSALYGEPGQGSTGDSVITMPDDRELRLPPLIRYTVRDPGAVVRSQPLAEQVLVSGSNEAVPAAVWDGVLTGRRPFLLSSTLSDSDIERSIMDGALLLITDSNRRHQANDNKLYETGPLLPAWRTGKNVRALGPVTDQTTVTYDGIADVTASSSGSIFGPTPTGRPFLAVDGDHHTGWTFGDFGFALGGWLRIDLTAPRRIDSLDIDRGFVGGRVVESLRVDVGDESRIVTFGAGSVAHVELDHPVVTGSVKVTVLSLAGTGNNQVAINEVSIPGVRARETVQTPTRVTDLARGDGALQQALTRNPPEVLFSRSAVEKELSVSRRFDYPVTSHLGVTAEVLETDHTRRWRYCHLLGTLDGRKILARAIGPVPQPRYDVDGNAIPVTLTLKGCSTTELTPGSHTFEADRDVRIDYLAMKSPRSGTQGFVQPSLSWHRDATDFDVTVGPSDVETYLFVAEAFEGRWTAVVDGQPAAPVLLNGYGMGIRLASGSGHTVHLFFAPQTRYPVAVFVSIVAAALCLLGALVGQALTSRSRRRDERAS